jgi:hypothetical protein
MEWLKKKGVKEVLFALIFLIFIINAVSSENVTSYLNISNGPPILIQPIPNFSWRPDTNLLNAFDLDNYFIDDTGEPVSYYNASSVENITVLINANNSVSFYPDSGFSGTETVIFYADDGEFFTPSNLVYLHIGSDTEPPRWYNPAKDKAVVYQNDYVNFSTRWTDNYELSNFIFSIKQNSAWTNYSEVFSGRENYSRYRIQISAPEFSTIYWYFCAMDASDNINCTDWQTFNVSNRSIPSSPPSAAPTSTTETATNTGAQLSESATSKKVKSYSVEPEYFKISLKQGSTETRLLKITNTGNTNLTFNLSVIGDIKNYVTLSESSFSVLPGETMKVTIDFSAEANSIPEEYFGDIKIESTELLNVPVVLDINFYEIDFSLDINIYEGYKSVRPGNIVKANITLKNLKDILRDNLTLYYSIKDIYGNIYDSKQESINIESFYSFNGELTVPASSEEGPYIFYARLFKDKIIAIDSDDFFVGVRFKFAALLKTYFILILIIILSILALVLILKYREEKKKERLLSLYLMLNELKNLVKEGKFDRAVQMYLKIKTIYGEPVSRNMLNDKERLKQEIIELSKRLKDDLVDSGAVNQKESEKSEENKDITKNEEKNPDGEKAEDKKVEKEENNLNEKKNIVKNDEKKEETDNKKEELKK